MKLFLSKVAGLSFFRFLLSGGVNTFVTYLIYIFLLNFCSYQESYTVAYVFGIVLAFFLGRFFVFKSDRGAKSIIFFPMIYLVQYLVSMGILWFWVDLLSLNDLFAPLVAIFITIPITYIISSFVFIKKA
jgi:putative flippase GtrA